MGIAELFRGSDCTGIWLQMRDVVEDECGLGDARAWTMSGGSQSEVRGAEGAALPSRFTESSTDGD